MTIKPNSNLKHDIAARIISENEYMRIRDEGGQEALKLTIRGIYSPGLADEILSQLFPKEGDENVSDN